MKPCIRVLAGILIPVLLPLTTLFAQTTSWKGTTSTSWGTASNWTNGIPTSSTDAILGDANFTGISQPSVNVTASCKSVTVGGTKTTTLTLTKNLVISGNASINSNATISHPASTLTVSGDWINNGTYTTTSGSAKIVFGGVTQSISGSSSTTFRRVTINTASTVTLNRNITVSGSNSYIYIYGTLNPGESPTYTVTSTVLFRIYSNGRAKVNAPAFAGNYVLSGTVSLNAGSIVEYSSTTTNQTVSNSYTYSTLVISGTSTKSLAGNLNSLNSSSSTRGNIFVNSGTLDLLTYTANRGTTYTGGEINVANGAALKIGGTNNFPSNYNKRTLNLNSTVEYYGTNQTIPAQVYGNLLFSSSSGRVTKTMPGTAFTIEGSFTSTIGSGTSVTYSAASNITMNGNVMIGASTTFNGGSSSHTVRGNWINNGTFTGSTGTVTFDGANESISGSGSQNFNNITFTSTGISASGTTSINVSGNLATTGSGQFTQDPGGLLTMTGTSKTISGTDIIFNDLAVTGTVSTTASFIVNGNLSVSNSFSASGGTVTMPGATKTISGAGTINFSELSLSGSITTASNFSISSLLDVSGTFSASAGTATFTGTSLLAGTANLYNVTINGTSLQLSSASVLGIAGAFTITSGALNTSSSTPNTVNFNGTGAQSVNAIAYYNLSFSNGNTKTAVGNITINGTITISAATTFSGGTYTHTILRNWINNGTYTASTGSIQFTGGSNATITGATTFNVITLNKSASTNTLTLANNIAEATVNMTSGKMLTGSNTLTITNTRTGNGIIFGTITRTHSFTTGTAYAFEGPDNTITFSAGTLATSTATVTHMIAGDFTMTGGSLSGTTSTYVLNGTSDQTLTLLSNLINLTVNKSAGQAVLGSNVTVNNITNLTAGKINLGNYNFTVGTAGSISNYSGAKHFIAQEMVLLFNR